MYCFKDENKHDDLHEYKTCDWFIIYLLQQKPQ